jgi:two-component system response regulator HydG
MKLGAFDFLTKPFTTQEIKNIVQSAINTQDTEPVDEPIKTLIGNSEYLRELKDTVKRVARTNSTVLLTGESGTGKELIASTIHNLSTRSSKPYLPVDCSSLVENLMETELFGHVKGAFSGATETRDGRFQMANKGTLFIDEISNLSLSVQAKLLRVIQEQEVPRVGSSVPEKVDVRLITATNKDLRSMVDKSEFREDLFYRISVVPIHIKPLREHKSDILPIAEYYLDFFSKKHSDKTFFLSEEAKKSIVSYSWPGNVRELKNTIERLCVLCDNEEISLSDILYYGQKTEPKTPVFDSVSGRMTLVEVEKEHIEKALDHFNFQISKTACFLGIDRKTLRLKIRNYGIKTRE